VTPACVLQSYFHLQSTVFVCANEPHWGREPTGFVIFLFAVIGGYIIGRVWNSDDPGD
jgi:hypothetical protein